MSLIFPRVAAAAGFDDTQAGLLSTGSQAGLSGVAGGSLSTFIGKYVIAPILGLMGLLLLVLAVYAGFLWMTAQGNPKQVEKAQTILKEAVIGAVILVSAYALASFVVTSLATAAA